MSYINTISQGGIEPLRHHDRRYPLETRIVRHAARVVDRDAIGRFNVADGFQDTMGDIVGAHFWEVDKTKRPLSGWAFAWPAIAVGTPNPQTPPSTPPQSPPIQTPGFPDQDRPQGETKPTPSGNLIFIAPDSGRTFWEAPICGPVSDEEDDEEVPGSVSVLPIRNRSFDPDDRFKPIEITGQGISPGQRGIVLAATNEDEQESIFFPVGGTSLVAVNNAGDPGLGTKVYDLDEEGKIDPTRAAQLQTAWWVVKKWIDRKPTLAWNLSLSGCHDGGGGGLVIDMPTPSYTLPLQTSPNTQTVIQLYGEVGSGSRGSGTP